MEHQQTIGDRIRFSRLIKRWSQRDLAKKIQCSRPTIANWESSKTEPSQYSLARLSEALGVTVEYLKGE